MASHPKETPSRKEQTLVDKCMQQFKFHCTEKIKGIDIDFYNCCVCSAKLNARKRHNLVQHLKISHRDIFDVITDMKILPIKLQRLQFLQFLIEMVSLNGRPFNVFLDSGFQGIIKKDLDKFSDAGCAINLSDKNFTEIKQHMHEMSEKIRVKIKEEVAARPLSLLVDIVTKNQRSIFGISVQFIIDGELKIRSLGMIELIESHTAVYLAEILCERLKVLGINLKQVFTITTVSGSNVLKMVRDIDNILHQEVDAAQNITFTQLPSIDDTQTDDQIANFLAEQADFTDEEAISAVLEDAISTEHENLLRAVCDEIDKQTTNVLWNVEGVKCAAHIAQLSTKDGVKQLDDKHRNVIDLCRRVAKTLRVESVRNEMKNIGMLYKIPRIEIETRWCTLHLMVRKKYFS